MKNRISGLVWGSIAVIQMWIIVFLSQWIYINDHSLKPGTLTEKFVLFVSQATVGFFCDLYGPYLITMMYVVWFVCGVLYLVKQKPSKLASQP